ncbi:Platinum sensitivity protein, partial [Basidiobolus ranarum]
MEISTKRRVKVYELGDDSAWKDKGTGYCVCLFYEDNEELDLLVRSEEENPTVLLNSKVVKGDIYQKQQETLIVWTEPDGRDLALSFQEAEGCAEVWDMIMDMQKRLPDLPIDSANRAITLPSPELSNLTEIETIVKQVGRFVYGRDTLVNYVIQEKYIDKLLPLLDVCEDLDNIKDLYTLCSIIKGLLLLNENAIFEYIVQDDVILGVVGILEYDPDYPNSKAQHRQYLANNSKFKQVVPIKDPSMENKIHQTFRLQYLKDVVLARVLDESTFSILNSLIFFNHVDIVNHFQHDHDFLKQLFGILDNANESSERKHDVIRFVQQFCAISKNLQMISRSGLYRALSQHGLFCIFDYSLPDPDSSVRVVGAEVLCSILDHDPNLVRSYILAQVKQARKPLIQTVVERFIDDDDVGVKVQYAELIKVFLDTSSGFGEHSLTGPAEALMQQKNDPEANEFLSLFYDRFIKQLFAPVLKLDNYQEGGQELVFDTVKSSLYFLSCELMCLFIRTHSFRSKYFILSTDIGPKFVALFKSRDNHLKLAALRFIRACVGMRDEFYHKHLIQFDLFSPVVNTLLQTRDRDNLVNSACLELFEFIRKENSTHLVDHIVQEFGDRLEQIEYVETFKLLRRRYEQNTDSNTGNETVVSNTSECTRTPHVQGQSAWESSTLDDEEAYFNTSDDEDVDQPGTNSSTSDIPPASSDDQSQQNCDLARCSHEDEENPPAVAILASAEREKGDIQSESLPAIGEKRLHFEDEP